MESKKMTQKHAVDKLNCVFLRQETLRHIKFKITNDVDGEWNGWWFRSLKNRFVLEN